jgi:hypothetical protein
MSCLSEKYVKFCAKLITGAASVLHFSTHQPNGVFAIAFLAGNSMNSRVVHFYEEEIFWIEDVANLGQIIGSYIRGTCAAIPPSHFTEPDMAAVQNICACILR